MRAKIHRIVYLLLLVLLAVSMTTSNFLMNLAWVLLFANWVIEWDMKRKFSELSHNWLLMSFLLLLVLHLVGLIWTDNLAYGLDDIRKKLPLFAIPLVVLTSKPLTRRQWQPVAFVYVGTVLVVSVIGLVRYLTIADLPYRRIVPFISHIRFCLNICMSIVLLLSAIAGAARQGTAKSRWIIVGAIVLILWLLFFMLLVQSYTGFAILFVTATVCLVVGWRRFSNKLRWSLMGVLLAVVVATVGVSAYYVNEYYNGTSAVTADSKTFTYKTVNGNPYTYAHDGLVENGNCVNDRVCEEEIRREWAQVSRYPVDSMTSTGYPLYPALLRYLNASGLGKDSVGVHSLTATDIKAIEQGVGNPVYLQPVSLRKMFYVMLFEYENYRCYHSVKDFTMLQRFELWHNGWQVFVSHPVIGVGTGDVYDSCLQQLETAGSPLAGTTKHTHNQYLALLVAFGAVGFLLWLCKVLYAVVHQRLMQSLKFAAAFTIVAVSFLTEDTLETLAGVVFVAFFLSLLSQKVDSAGNDLPSAINHGPTMDQP